MEGADDDDGGCYSYLVFLTTLTLLTVCKGFLEVETYCVLNRTLCSFGEEIRTQNFNIHNIIEVKIQT